MIRKLMSLAAAAAFALATLAPTPADAHRRHDGYYGRDYDHRYDRRHRRDDHDDAIAAGAVGLVLGLALGSMASRSNERRYSCSGDYQRCAPPPARYDDRGYYDRGDDPYYDDGYAPQRTCRVWDRYADRYVEEPC